MAESLMVRIISEFATPSSYLIVLLSTFVLMNDGQTTAVACDIRHPRRPKSEGGSLEFTSPTRVVELIKMTLTAGVVLIAGKEIFQEISCSFISRSASLELRLQIVPSAQIVGLKH
jgi:hypothetical protein